MFQKAADALRSGYHRMRSSETLENLRTRASELVKSDTLHIPSVSLLHAELDSLGNGIECILNYEEKEGPQKGAYITAVATESQRVREFVTRFNLGVGGQDAEQSVQELTRHLNVLRGAVPMTRKDDKESKDDSTSASEQDSFVQEIHENARNNFLMSEVSAIRPLIFSLSRNYGNFLRNGERDSLKVFLKDALPTIRNVLAELYSQLEGNNSVQSKRRRRAISEWVYVWFTMDLDLLALCPTADPQQIVSEQRILHKLKSSGV